MAIRRAEGFAHFTTAADWQAKGHNYAGQPPTFHPTSGRAGRGRAIMGQGGWGQELQTIMPIAMSPIYSHIAFNSPTVNEFFWGFYNSGNFCHIHLFFRPDGSISIYRDSTANTLPPSLTFATLLATSPPAVWRANTYHHVQIKLNPATSGSFLMKIDGVEIPSLTLNATNLSAGGAQNVTMISHTGVMGGVMSYSDEVDIDDVIDVAADQQWTGFQGDLGVYEAVTPIDGAELTWTRSSGAGTWSSHVNQNPQDGDATYDRSIVPGNNLCFSYPTISSTVGRVLAVKATACWRKEDASFGAIRLYSRDSLNVNHEGSLKSGTQTYKFDEYFWEKDRKDGANWDVGRVNATQLGLTDAGDEG